MLQCGERPNSMTVDEALASSGKGAGNENFPVGSFLIAKEHRPCVAAFYAFARAADDIADAPHLPGADKLRRLDVLEAELIAPREPKSMPARLKNELERLGLTDQHARTLLIAFRQDAVQSRYQTIEDLIDYCTKSADPVGRFLLDLHGEDPALYPASDALCTVLQILNHLQDCSKDLKEIDRVYLPQVWLKEAGTTTDALLEPSASPALRHVLIQCLEVCDERLVTAAKLSPRLSNRRLGAEAAVIFALASRLGVLLRAGDPVKHRISLSKLDFAAAGLKGMWRLLSPMRANS